MYCKFIHSLIKAEPLKNAKIKTHTHTHCRDEKIVNNN